MNELISRAPIALTSIAALLTASWLVGPPSLTAQDAQEPDKADLHLIDSPSSDPDTQATDTNTKSAITETSPEVAAYLIRPEGRDQTAMAIGDAGDRVRELQATLNKTLTVLQEESQLPGIGLAREILIGESKGVRPGAKNRVRTVYIPDRKMSFSIRGDWKPLDEEGKPLEFSQDEAKAGVLKQARRMELPEQPLKVDGIFGQHTYAAVMLFQLEENLPITGDVDPVTIDKLEPMIPTNPLLAAMMSWVGAVLDRDFEGYAWWVKTITAFMMSVVILAASFGVYQAAKILSNSTHFLSRWLFTPETSPWFTALRRNKVFLRSAQFAPAMFIYFTALAVFPRPAELNEDTFPYLDVFQDWHIYISRLGLAYAGLVFMLVALAVVSAFDQIYSPNDNVENPITGLVRAAKRFVGLAGTILIVAALAGRNPLYVVGGLGAFMAVIMLVFRDYLLGLVASVQIIANKMVQVGDWIEMPKYSADGDVQEISLNLVKVRNFDKTISTIPTYSLLTESFRNWSGMREAGGRRIKRSLFIDLHTIKVCTPKMVARFEQMELIQDYILKKKAELDEYNREHDIAASEVNARRLTNVGTFRAYLEAYLASHPNLSSEMTYMVRHLQPTKEGLPIEIYAYSTETEWAEYEAVQADIFDHILAILPEFDLRAFQEITEVDDKIETRSAVGELTDFLEDQNRYLATRKNTSVTAASKRVKAKIASLGLGDTFAVTASERTLSVTRL